MTPGDAAKGRDRGLKTLAGLVRRMVVKLSGKTSGPTRTLWQLLGVKVGESEEVVEAEHFLGIGFYSRPGSTGKPEAIVVNVGGANAPAIVAVRDEKTRAAIAGAIKAGETMVFNAVAVIYLKDDGTIEIRSPGGAAQALAFQSQLVALRNHVNGLLVGGSGSALNGLAPNVGAGTTVVKGE